MAGLRIGGLASGMDIDSIVEKLMVAERSPLDKLEQQKQTYEWQRDAYRDVNTKLKTFDTYIADNFILKSLNMKTATSSNSNLVDVIATSSATGTLSIEGVSQLATAARAVGSQVSLVGTSKISELTGTGFIELKAIQSNGEMANTATRIDITKDMSVNQFVSKVNSSNAGITMVFENGRFSITAKYTGDNKAGNEIEIVNGMKILEKLGFASEGTGENTSLVQTVSGKNAVFQVNGIATERSTNNFTISGYNITLKNTFNANQTIAEKYKAAKKELELATENESLKNNALNNPTNGAIFNYYGEINSTSRPNYTTTHNSKYKDAFGDTLNLSQQEIFNKLGNSFWKGLSDDEITFLANLNVGDKAIDIRAAINGESNLNIDKSKLNGISDEKLELLANISTDNNFEEIKSFKEQAKYQTYGTKFKEFFEIDQAVLDSFTYNADDSIETIKQKIDSYSGFNDDIKKVLKSLNNKEDLINLLDADATTLATYQEKVKSDELKKKYNELGDALINKLSIAPSTTLTEAQAKAWDSLSNDEKNKFKELAEQNQLRQTYINAEADYKNAVSRLTSATNTFDTARKDLLDSKLYAVDENNDKVLDANGHEIVDELAIDSSPKENAVQLSSTTNTNEIIERIKEFVKTYNGLITDLNNLINETKYRDYKPLTTIQKKEMEENEIKLWEEKAKSGLLRGDSIIKNGLYSIRSHIYESNPTISNSKYNTLYSIGITTSKDYTSGGMLEIDENKLRAALEADPEAVTQLLTSDGEAKETITINGENKVVDTRGFLRKLRSEMDAIKIKIEERAGRTSMSETQYTLGKYLKNVNTSIDTWQDKLKNIETRYWKQFTAMETMINKANQQSTSLSSYFA